MNIKEFSRRCGLSVSTVSKALNNYPDVSEKTRLFVQKKAAQLGYHANAQARALKMGKTFNLGVLFDEGKTSALSHHYFSTVLDGFQVEAARQGYDISFINHHIGTTKMTYLEHCRYRNLDGICLASVNYYDPEIIQLVTSGIPIITIDHEFDQPTSLCIRSENHQGIWDMVHFLHSQGHYHIAFIYGNHCAVTQTRVQSFTQTMAHLNLPLPPEYMIEGDYHQPELIKKNTKKLLNLSHPPTCIMLSDDYSALGAFEAAKELGLVIPEDISIVGFDGIPHMQFFSPKLTTVYQDATRIGLEAAIQLINLIENPKEEQGEHVVIPCEIWPGETVKNLSPSSYPVPSP